MTDSRFTRYRADGWPICPQCDEDELYSHVCLCWDGVSPRPSLAESLAGDFTCYLCAWSSGPAVTIEQLAPERLAASRRALAADFAALEEADYSEEALGRFRHSAAGRAIAGPARPVKPETVEKTLAALREIRERKAQEKAG